MDLKKIMIPKGKKGMGIQDLYPAILIIAIAAILLAVVFMILTEFSVQMSNNNYRVINETFEFTEAGTQITNATVCGFRDFAVQYVGNATGNESLPLANFTYNVDAGIIYNLNSSGAIGSSDFNATNMNATYTYIGEQGSGACQATEDIIQDFIDFIPWIGIILLIIAAAIVIGIVIKSFAGGKRM